MKKNLAKVISLALVLIMVFLLGGCSNEKNDVLGTWQAEINLADFLNESMDTGDEELNTYVQVDTFNVTMVLKFNEDDTYSLKLDADKFNTAIEQLKDDVQNGLEQYLLDMMADNGLEMTIDEIMELMGVSMEEMLDAALTEDMIQELLDSSASEGKFQVKDGKLYLSSGLNYEVNKEVFGNYKVEGNKFTLLDYADEADTFMGMYPLTFTKVS